MGAVQGRPEHEPEHEMVNRARAGDIAAFNQLVHAFQRRVFNVCARTLGRTDDAADATQETFLRAYRSISHYRAPSERFQPWLLRIATNVCLDQLRHRRRHPTSSLDVPRSDDSAAALELSDGHPSPEDRLMSAETIRTIELGLSTLSIDHRLVLVLCDVQELPYEEVVQILSIELGTVKSRLSRARAHLRDFCREQGELPMGYRRLYHHEPPRAQG